MSAIEILPVSSGDLPTLADFLYTSKLSLTINRLLFKDWPNETAQRPNYAGAIKVSFEDPTSECLKAVHRETGDVLGFVVVTKRLAQKIEQGGNDKLEAPKVPESMDPVVFRAVVEASAELKGETKGIDHFEITYIYVKPSERRNGVGSQLLREGFERAKHANLPLVVSSEPAGHEFFFKNGFTESKHIDFDLSEWAPPYTGFGIFRLVRLTWKV